MTTQLRAAWTPEAARAYLEQLAHHEIGDMIAQDLLGVVDDLRDAIRQYIVEVGHAPANRDEDALDAACERLVAAITPQPAPSANDRPSTWVCSACEVAHPHRHVPEGVLYI